VCDRVLERVKDVSEEWVYALQPRAHQLLFFFFRLGGRRVIAFFFFFFR